VRRDVANGFFAAAEAVARYGVVIDDARVDLEATRRRRSGRSAPAPEFTFGREREDYERRLPPGVQDAVAAELAAYSGSYRNFLKEQVYDALTANGASPLDPVALRERVREILKSVRLGAGGAA
jgi:N-methylhydantoinase B